MVNPIYQRQEDCCGCKACIEACPKQCISIIKDSEHFVYPLVDETACIECHKCEKVCPIKKADFNTIKESYAGVHEPSEVFLSASGGAFWALCQILIPKGYIIVGVRWTDNHDVVHDVAYTLEEAQYFRKSKYILSDTNGVFSKVKRLLKDGNKVVFTGSPCQVAACKNFIGVCDNLLLVDLVCHGAPNQDIFNKEVEYLECKHGGKLERFQFRNKKPVSGTINSRSASYKISGKEYLVDMESDPFLKGYYSRLFYRPSCGTCRFAKPERVGDITLADAWGINDLYPELNDLAGVSLVLFNSYKGQMLIHDLKRILNLKKVNTDWAILGNHQLRMPTKMHSKRDTFFASFENDFYGAVYSCTRDSFFNRLKKKVKKMVFGTRK